MIILDEFVDFIKVIRIEMIAFYAKMSLNRFGKELRFISVSLGDFVRVVQSWIIAMTLGLRKFLIFRRDSLGSVSRLIELQNFSQLTTDSTLNSSLTCFCN